jgi:hypothetical protein
VLVGWCWLQASQSAERRLWNIAKQGKHELIDPGARPIESASMIARIATLPPASRLGHDARADDRGEQQRGADRFGRCTARQVHFSSTPAKRPRSPLPFCSRSQLRYPGLYAPAASTLNVTSIVPPSPTELYSRRGWKSVQQEQNRRVRRTGFPIEYRQPVDVDRAIADHRAGF